ncbi:MAG: cytochrome c oxidase subunit II [bacterium]
MLKNAILKTLSLPTALAGAMTALSLLPAYAFMPEDGAITMQEAATPLAEEVHVFHNAVLMPIITFISLLVLALLIWIILRYNKKANPEPAKFSHNTLVEVIWTGVPILILLYIALFSFDLLYAEGVLPDGKKQEFVSNGSQTEYVFTNDFTPDRNVRRNDHLEVFTVGADGARTLLKLKQDYKLANLGKEEVSVTLMSAPAAGTKIELIGGRSRSGPEPFLGLFGEDRSHIVLAPTITIKATGRQWGWNYAYPDFGDFEVDAILQEKANLSDPRLYLLQATNNVVVPEGETIRIITTASDVIHSWAIPAFAIKIDAVPGRLNETWFQAPAPGMYYGQCSEICGKDHAFMPISLEVKSREDFNKWVDEQRELNGEEPLFAKRDAEQNEADSLKLAANQIAE